MTDLVALSGGFSDGGEEVHDTALNGEFDPSVNELAKALVDGKPESQRLFGSCADKATNRFPAVDVSQLVIGTVPLGMLRVHAPAANASTHLILFRDTSRMHQTEGLQFGLDASDFLFELRDRGCFYVGYAIYNSHLCQHIICRFPVIV